MRKSRSLCLSLTLVGSVNAQRALFVNGAKMKYVSTKEQLEELDWELVKDRKISARKNIVQGVYMFVNNITNEVMYIGQSNNIGHRILGWHCDEYRNQEHDLYILRIDDPEERKMIEFRAIELIHTKNNKRNGIYGELSHPPESVIDDIYRKVFG